MMQVIVLASFIVNNLEQVRTEKESEIKRFQFHEESNSGTE